DHPPPRPPLSARVQAAGPGPQDSLVHSSARRAAGLVQCGRDGPAGGGVAAGEFLMSETTGEPGGWGEMPAPRLEAPPVVAPPPLYSPPPAEDTEPLVPWISIWSRPRATLRRILKTDPRRSVFLLAALGGIAGALDLAT